MAESRVVFTKSKMNKDLDERILTPGEYRDGFNISVSKSEGPDEGVVENVLGNSQLTNFTWAPNVDIIGVYEDTNNDRIYLFATNYTDASDNQLDNFAPGEFTDDRGLTVQAAECFIAYRDLVTGAEDILVSGNFLNFSKTHPIYAVDLVEDLLFWTDNRNQPRKINVETAIANPETYYLNEDHISVSKYMPYKPLSLVYLDGATWKSSMINDTERFLAPNSLWLAAQSTSYLGQSNVIEFPEQNPDVVAPGVGPSDTYFVNLNFPELGVFKVIAKIGNDRIQYAWPDPAYPSLTGNQIRDLVEESAATFTDRGTPGTDSAFQPNDVLAFFYENPEYNVDYDGDEDYLKERFIRFSYRFKYDDGEYSLMAPFTQAAFVPKQYGYFIDTSVDTLVASVDPPANTKPVGGRARRDERDAAASGIVKFMENQVSTIKFRLELPEAFGLTTATSQDNFSDDFKVESIEILLKESDGLAIRVVEEIEIADAFSGSDDFYIYDYLSNKPFKTLPEAVTTRVHDKVPIKALAQATTGNRVMYGNFVENHASPDNLNYFLGYRPKPNLQSTPVFRQSKKEYPNHTVKQNRSYKVGVVLVDRYGRSSNVILRDPTQTLGIGKKDSTIYAPYTGGGESPLNWPGNNITISFLDVIPTAKTSDGYPGVFTSTNPLGYYSYKVVVQQQQQEYYNVYVPGATSGIIRFTGELSDGSAGGAKPFYDRTKEFSNIVLFGDNINKVPKQLSDVGPTEEIYGSETLLYPRVVTKYITASSNVGTGTAAALGYQDQLAVSKNSQVEGKFTSEVSSIISFNDLGPWTAQRGRYGSNSSYPNNAGTPIGFIDPLYVDASSNPFVAQISTSFVIGLSKKDQDGVVNPSNVYTTTPKFSRALNVFETNPVESNIEIYWESTTSGNIETLNDLITSNTGFVDAQSVDFTLDMSEETYGAGGAGPITVAQVQPLDQYGVPAGFGTVTLTDVRDGNNYNQLPNFQLTPVGGSLYDLEYTGDGIPVVSDLNVSTLDFTFTVQGIGTYTGVEVTNQVVRNIAPVAGLDWQTTWNGNALGGPGVVLGSTSFLLYSGTVDYFRNGCLNSNNYHNGVARETTVNAPAGPGDIIIDVTTMIPAFSATPVFELLPRGATPAGLFELYASSGPPSIGIEATSSTAIASYPLTLRVTDRSGTGLSADFDFDLVLS